MTDETKITARAREVFDIEIEGLRRVRDSVGKPFADAVAMMCAALDAGGLVVVTGVGKCLHVAEKTSAVFASTGTRSIVLNPVQAMHGDLGMTGGKDVLLALSFSGESDEVVRLVPAVRRHGLKVIAMTGCAESTLAHLADITLETPCGAEACPFGMAPTTSAVSMMAMGDALAMAMVDVRHFDRESYALNHPAGAIGRALVMRATDVMRPADKCAAVRPEAAVLDALMAMTAAKSGAAAVTDEEGVLRGIFTDGDFRRAVSAGGPGARAAEDVLSSPVSRYMTPDPLFVKEGAYAAELLKVFERRRIDDLPVCGENGRFLGLVDIQDLPKMKVL